MSVDFISSGSSVEWLLRATDRKGYSLIVADSSHEILLNTYIRYDPSQELSHIDDANEGSHHMFCGELKKNSLFIICIGCGYHCK